MKVKSIEHNQSKLTILFVIANKGLNMIRSNFCLPFFEAILKFISNRYVDKIQITQKCHLEQSRSERSSFVHPAS